MKKLLLIFILLLAKPVSAGFASEGYQWIFTVDIPASLIDVNGTYEILMDENNLPAQFFTGSLSSGADLKFSTDLLGNDSLDVEYRVMNIGGIDAQVWVEVPNVSSSSTTRFYGWFGRPGVSFPSLTDQQKAWGNHNAELVYGCENQLTIPGSPQVINSRNVPNGVGIWYPVVIGIPLVKDQAYLIRNTTQPGRIETDSVFSAIVWGSPPYTDMTYSSLLEIQPVTRVNEIVVSIEAGNGASVQQFNTQFRLVTGPFNPLALDHITEVGNGVQFRQSNVFVFAGILTPEFLSFQRTGFSILTIRNGAILGSQTYTFPTWIGIGGPASWPKFIVGQDGNYVPFPNGANIVYDEIRCRVGLGITQQTTTYQNLFNNPNQIATGTPTIPGAPVIDRVRIYRNHPLNPFERNHPAGGDLRSGA